MAYVTEGEGTVVYGGTNRYAPSIIRWAVKGVEGDSNVAFFIVRLVDRTTSYYILYSMQINQETTTVPNMSTVLGYQIRSRTDDWSYNQPFNFPYGEEYVEFNLNQIDKKSLVSKLNCADTFLNVSAQNRLMTKVEGITDTRDLSTNVPIYTFDSSTMTCSEFVSNILPYFDEGDYSKADNAEDLDAVNIEFVANADDDSKTLFINWNISPEEQTQISDIEVRINLIDIEIPTLDVTLDMFTSNIHNQITLSYDYIRTLDSNSNLSTVEYLIKMRGVGQDDSAWVELYVYFGFGKTVYKVNKGISDNTRNTLILLEGKPDEDAGYTSQEDESDETDSENNSYSGLAQLTTVYKTDENLLKSFGNFLWSNSLFENLRNINNSPIENIVAVKAIPIDVPTVTDSSPIELGNVDTNLKAPTVKDNYTFDVGTIRVPHRKDGIEFLDYEGFTSISIYLPYIGIKPLSPNVVMGKKINLKYTVDIVNGTCTAIIRCLINDKWDIVEQFDGAMGIEIPVTSSNRATVESAILGGVASGAISLASGDIGGAIGNVASGMLTPFHSNTKGNTSGLLAKACPTTAFIMLVRPKTQIPSTFNHNVGRKCGLSKELGKLKGYTVLDSPIMSDLNCLEDEKEELRTILTTGFYI